MSFLLAALALAVVAGLGRQITVFARIEQGLWLFSHWRRVRIGLTTLSLLLALVGILTTPAGVGWALLLVIVFLIAFSYFFEMPFFFPEVKQVQRAPAVQQEVDAARQVIGVTVGNTAVAYPIHEIVMPRHLVHDAIAGTAVLITYCALCRSALAFEAEVDGQPLTFRVAGVWRRNMIIIDEQTHSIWQQATGTCIFGKYRGRQLTLLSGENTIWKSWRRKHPNTEYAYQFTEARKGLLSRETMLAGLKAVTPRAGTPGFTDLKGLPKRETVFGVTVNGESKAYPLSQLEPEMRFYDRVGGVAIELNYDEEARYLSATEKKTGKPLVVEKHWWLGWKEFHPRTTIWQKSPVTPARRM